NRKLSYKNLKGMPANLRNKLIREARNRNENILGRKNKKFVNIDAKKVQRKQKNAFEHAEHKAMLSATEEELEKILSSYPELSDVPADATAQELLGQLALATGQATTVYVMRTGLPTLTVVLHQPSPTIAQLKKAIATIALAQHKRSQRQQVRALAEDEAGAGAASKAGAELVNSAQRTGHVHRAQVSWRFLWRCYCLFNGDEFVPIDDRAESGRATLTSLGIKNGAKLTFVHRAVYFGRRRQG
ncbi:CG34313, partial [Drosophila busckii]